MKKKHVIPFFFLFWLLASCSANNSPESTANDFWQAVIEKDMEKAKSLATWDTTEYLKYLNKSKLHPERFELGETMMGERSAEIAVVLHTASEGGESIRIPGKTILIKTEHGWRVDVKQSLGSVVKQTVNNVFDQLNNMMQKGIKELDQSFSDSMNDIGKSLEEGAKELQRELEHSLPKDKVSSPQEI
ncbi:MAG: hypothetical protein KAG28_08760 [Cocleimonas sp.]|nr:hypothetical protein [Cocleimonas sp.]